MQTPAFAATKTVPTSKLFRGLIWVAAAAAACLCPALAYGQTQVDGATSGHWSGTSSWNPAVVPNNGGGNTYDVTLLNSPAVTITLDISPTIDTLTLDTGSTLQSDTSIAGTTLTTTGVSDDGKIQLSNGNTLTVNGAMTVGTTGYFDLDRASTLVVNGSLSNSGQFFTNAQSLNAGPNTVTVAGIFANNAGATARIGFVSTTANVMNVATLVNNGSLYINSGATLNLTNQPNGVTDVAQGSALTVYGSLNAGTANGFAKLGSVEGALVIGTGQTFTDTPGSGTLTTSSGSGLDLEFGTKMTVSGNLSNAGQLDVGLNQTGFANTLTVTGTFTNSASGVVSIGAFSSNPDLDVMNVGTLVNNGMLEIETGATLNLTNQPNGITDIASGSEIFLFGSLNAGTANALAKLNSIEGNLLIQNGQAFTDKPGSGTLTIAGGDLSLSSGSLTVSGNLTNSGGLGTDDTLTVTGTFTNNGVAQIGFAGGATAPVVTVAKLINNGMLIVGGTLNLTNQPNGITDIAANTTLQLFGKFNAGGNNALAKLGSVEGTLEIENGQTFTVTPGSGTLTVSGTGLMDLDENTHVTIDGNLTNSGFTGTNIEAKFVDGSSSGLTVTGAFTNNAGANALFGAANNSNDVVTVATLVNNGNMDIGSGTTLNLTNQPNGLTDIVAGSSLQVDGTFTAGSSFALAKLKSIEGSLTLGIPGTSTVMPGSGTLTISNTGSLFLSDGNLTVSGNLTNAGQLTVEFNSGTVTGAFTNSTGAITTIGDFGNNPPNVLNVASLNNAGSITAANGVLDITGAGTATNSGTITLHDGGTVKFSGSNLSLSGGGTITLTTDNLTVNLIEGASGSNTLTNVDNTIQGAGNIGNGQMALNNQATIDANQVSHVGVNSALVIQTSGGTTNSGKLEATNKGTLILDGGTVTNTGQGSIISTGSGSTVELENGVIVTGGTLSGTTSALIETLGGQTATLNGVIISGNYKAADKSTTTIEGTITNNGTIALSSTGGVTELVIGAPGVSVAGKGKLVLSNNSSNIITGAAATDVLTSSNTIQGSGNIGNGQMGLVNTGTILANQSSLLEIDVSTAGFDNKGTLTVNNSDTLEITGAANSFANFNSGTGALTGGTYVVNGTLKFDGANIVTNAATITLSGTTAAIIDQNGKNALANFATNASTGSFTLAGNHSLTTTGAFSNAGILKISTGSTLTLGGNFSQTAGTTTVDGNLTTADAINISGGFVYGNAGTLAGNLDLTGGKLNPGDGLNRTGDLNIAGTYTESGAGTLNMDLGGTIPDTKYDVLNISGTASLGGTLNVDLISGFKPTVGESFDIVNYSSETGKFATLVLPTLTGGDTWSVSYNATGVVLTVDGPAAARGAESASPARRASRGLIAGAAADGGDEPVAILSRAACFGARLLMASAACGSERLATVASGGEMHAVASTGAGSGAVHNNNITVATRAVSTARGGDSSETPASAATMARLYVCVYLPFSVAHTMGCN